MLTVHLRILSALEQSPWEQRRRDLPLEVSQGGLSSARGPEGPARLGTTGPGSGDLRQGPRGTQCAPENGFHVEEPVRCSEISFLL